MIFIVNKTLHVVPSQQLKTNSRLRTVSGYNDTIYFGTFTNIILAVDNNITILKKISNICKTGYISSIVFDDSGNMLVSCFSDQVLYLYYANLTYSEYYLNTTVNPRFAKIDSKGRLIVGGENGIEIFY